MSRFFYDDVPYNGDVVHTTCTNSRTTGTTPASLGLTQLNFLNYAPGGAGYWSPGKRLAIADFEFGQVRLEHQVSNPQPTVTIPLTAPLVRSCPFAVTVHDTLAFVVGREGEAGTSTENCNNYRGVWKVDLTTNMVTGWLSLGGMLRYAEYGADDKLYVTDYATDKVHVVNPLDMTLNRSISVRDGPVGLKLTPDAGRMLVTNWNINGVQLIDLSNDQEIDYVPSGGVHPVNVLLLGSTVVVLNFGDAATSTGATLKAFTMQ